MVWYLWLLLLVSYGVLTWRSVLDASSPLRPCHEYTNHELSGAGRGGQGHHDTGVCFRPTVHVGGSIGLMLELYQPIDQYNTNITTTTRRQNFHWVPIESCQLHVRRIPPTGRLPQWLTTTSTISNTVKLVNVSKNTDTDTSIDNDDDNNNNSLCEVPIPNFARHRSSDSSSVRPLQGRFVIVMDPYDPNQRKVVGSTVPFLLTRMKERRASSSSASFGATAWNTILAADASESSIQQQQQRRRNLLQDPLSQHRTTTTTTTTTTNATKTNMNQTTTTASHNDNNNIDKKEKREEEEEKQEDASSSQTMWIPYLKFGRAPVRIRFVAEDRGYALPLQRSDGIALYGINNSHYGPIVYVDEVSLPRSAQIELAPPQEDRPPVRLQIKFSSISPMVDSILRQLVIALDTAEGILPGEGGGAELDELRYLLQDERLYRFALTQIISYIHVWFDYLAFRDEIRFYRGRRNLSGVSVSTVLTRLACSVIILLYLLDGGGTSWVVLLSLFSSCTVEAWKVWKLLRLAISPRFPFVSISTVTTSQDKETAEYDRIAFRYLALILYPIVIAWSLYALNEYEYKSWYSWLISNLANAVYTFGFISLCPQLYVNYRLKSVAHLPWKVFMYKIFNTFVDDAFAWLIEMPLKHRIMTLRDDVVFVIFLVQVYIYRVDKSRTNEFGYSYKQEGDDEDNNHNKNNSDVINSDNSNRIVIVDDDDDDENATVDGQPVIASKAKNEAGSMEKNGGKLKSE
jgi:hypothetical protein